MNVVSFSPAAMSPAPLYETVTVFSPFKTYSPGIVYVAFPSFNSMVSSLPLIFTVTVPVARMVPGPFAFVTVISTVASFPYHPPFTSIWMSGLYGGKLSFTVLSLPSSNLRFGCLVCMEGSCLLLCCLYLLRI